MPRRTTIRYRYTSHGHVSSPQAPGPTPGILLNCIDMPFVFLTVFDVVRNQYFYLGETVLVEVPYAANCVL